LLLGSKRFLTQRFLTAGRSRLICDLAPVYKRTCSRVVLRLLTSAWPRMPDFGFRKALPAFEFRKHRPPLNCRIRGHGKGRKEEGVSRLKKEKGGSGVKVDNPPPLLLRKSRDARFIQAMIHTSYLVYFLCFLVYFLSISLSLSLFSHSISLKHITPTLLFSTGLRTMQRLRAREAHTFVCAELPCRHSSESHVFFLGTEQCARVGYHRVRK
jgi:hypothetical protein